MPFRRAETKIVKHRYANHFTAPFTVQANNYQLLRTFKANSPVNPDGLGGDWKKTSGCSEMGAKYYNYVVLGSKMKITMHPQNAATAEEVTQHVLFLASAQQFISFEYRDLCENNPQKGKHSKVIKMLYGGSGKNETTVVTNKWSWKTFDVNRGNYIRNSDYISSFTSTQGPTKTADFDAYVYKTDNTQGWSSPVWDYDVEIEYIILWMDPKQDYVTG